MSVHPAGPIFPVDMDIYGWEGIFRCFFHVRDITFSGHVPYFFRFLRGQGIQKELRCQAGGLYPLPVRKYNLCTDTPALESSSSSVGPGHGSSSQNYTQPLPPSRSVSTDPRQGSSTFLFPGRKRQNNVPKKSLP